MKKVDLSKFRNEWYKPGSMLKRIIWYVINSIFFKSYIIPKPYGLKVYILKIFGTSVGRNIIIKPNVNIKYPWFLEIGNNSQIGEEVWIDNFIKVKIGNNVCISQGAYIMTGNHNYKKETFDLVIKPIIIEDGVWIGAKTVICPGVTLRTHSVITVGSIVTGDTEPYTVYQGVPAKPIRKRIIE